MAQESAKGDVLQRCAGVAFIVGAILTGVFNALYPRAEDPSNTQQVLAKLAENETFSLITMLALAVGFWALMVGATGVYRSISSGAAADWTRLGFYGVIVGTTLTTASLAVGMATTGAAADWVAAGSGLDNSAFSIAATLSAASNSLFFVSIIVYWLALTFLGIGMAMSDVYPKWLGWSLLVLGAATVVVSGVPQSLSDPSQTFDYIFAVLGGLTTLWALATGIIMTRRQVQLM